MALVTPAVLAFGLGSPAALAQDAAQPPVPELNAQLYRIPIDAERTLWTDDSGMAPDHHVRAKLGFIYARDPLVYRYDGSNEEVRLLSDVLQADLIGAWSFRRVRVGLDLPLYLASASEVAAGGGGLGDIAVDLKWTILSRQEGAPIGFALGTRFGLPTSTVAAPVGGAGLTWTLQGIVDYEAGPVLLAANLGTVVNPDDPQGLVTSDQLLYRLGAGYALEPEGRYGLSTDLAGRVSYRGDVGPGGAPAELLFGGWGRFSEDWVTRGGVGTGISQGIGAPTLRLVASVGYEPPALIDRDGDGVVDRLDACVTEPEDLDGWQDDDGCPDPSVRLTGMVVDYGGEPVPTALVRLTVEDGVATLGGNFTRDIHPGRWSVTVEADGFKPFEGAITVPEAAEHREQLAIEALVSRVTVTAVDPSGAPVAGGEMQVGASPSVALEGGMGSIDVRPGEYDVIVRSPGYKTARLPISVLAGRPTDARVTLEPARATVTRERIVIEDKIFFETDKAVIRPQSFSLLDELAQLLQDYPEVRLVRIEGHTDQRGSADYNRKLSEARAQAVLVYLSRKGIEGSRMTSEGVGEDRPLDPADTPEAWEQNRRVEFVVVEWDAEARQ